ncbi:YkyA family protein [Bacillus paranthracis]
MKYGKVAVVGALSVGLLTGCFGEKPEENLYTAFETAATQEKSLVDEAKKLEKLEKEGQELYSQILQEGKDHNDAVMKKIEQATANVDDREKTLKNEKEMLEKSSERNEICSRKYREA